LNTISESTIKQSKLAIPTLKGSNSLANQITQIGNLTLRAYYQSELLPLNNNLSSYNEAQDSFTNELKQLKRVVQGENTLLSNLRQVDGVYSSLQNNIKQVFDNRKNNIVQLSTLIDKIDLLEEKADDAATLMLDLADHDLADSTLQRAVGLGEQLETLLNSLVSSSFEYRDLLDLQTTELVEKEMVNMYDDILLSVQEINNELSTNSASDISDQLSSTSNEIKLLVEGTGSIFNHKMTQLKAIDLATEKLAAAESDINKVNDILAKQVELANKTTNDTGILVDNTVSKANTQTIFIAAISIVLAIVIAWFTLISITRPLSRVNEMLNVVASGDLSKKLDETGQDEFAQLSKNCNLLIESLRNLINGIVSRSTQLATAAEQTSAVTSQSTTAIIEQRSQVEQAASATTEMSSTSQSVLSSANDALGEIKQADDEAERVKGISERNRATIELLANEVEDASQVINKLQQDSASIGSILDVIRGIAEQTNLLALNAAIEAARAGEQGRGFAVVADEVRTLASRTQESTQEIQNMIEVLQSGAEKAVSVMDTGKKQAADCVVQSEEADKALETITHAVHEAFDRSSQIATAAEEQSVVAHEISENLESIVAIAEQTTAGSQQTAESSSEVARLAEELQQSVQEFKL
jgi:methyl-accepting chemotaxis protein